MDIPDSEMEKFNLEILYGETLWIAILKSKSRRKVRKKDLTNIKFYKGLKKCHRQR